MGLARRLLEGAVNKMDEIGERAQAAELEKLTPAQRERYEAWEARAGEPAAQLGDPRLTGRVLQGPAGEVSAGVAKLPKTSAIDDPQAWDIQMRAERAARDEIRRPYLAPDRRPVRISRVAATGKTQTREVAEYLATSGLAGRPDLVYGAYRVPDLIGRGGEIVEWDVVHAAEGTLAPATAPTVTTLDAEDRWVLRAPGERSPLDEVLALHVLARSGIGPERTLAIARDVAIGHSGSSDDGSSRIDATVRGVHVLAAGALDTDGAPWRLGEGPPDDVHLEVLQWDAIAKVVHPVRQHRAPLPSPFPYLPLTPQELLRAYLEIVGIDPADAVLARGTVAALDGPPTAAVRFTTLRAERVTVWLEAGERAMCATAWSPAPSARSRGPAAPPAGCAAAGRGRRSARTTTRRSARRRRARASTRSPAGTSRSGAPGAGAGCASSGRSSSSAARRPTGCAGCGCCSEASRRSRWAFPSRCAGERVRCGSPVPDHSGVEQRAAGQPWRVPDEGGLMQIPKDKILELLRSRGQDDKAQQADNELPDQVDTEQHAGQLEKLGIDPGDLAGSLGGIGDKLGL